MITRRVSCPSGVPLLSCRGLDRKLIFNFFVIHYYYFLPHNTDEGHDHGHKHGHTKDEEIPAWKKKALESGATDPMAAPFGGDWKAESSLSASDKMEE